MTDATARRAVTVRAATPADVEPIREVAAAAFRATYVDLVPGDAIERFLLQAYDPGRVALRIERDDIVVAAAADAAPGAVAAFAESRVEADHVQLVAIYAHPDALGRGLGTALLGRVRERRPDLDIAADVLLGNVPGERFYVARGFQSGGLLVEEIAGVPIRERRWWLRAGG